jgi:hypothetical protein
MISSVHSGYRKLDLIVDAAQRGSMPKILSAALVFLTGCAANPGVAPMGPDTYVVTRQAATGFSGTGDLKVEALREANQHCMSLKKEMHVVSATESQPPYIFGKYPRAEVQFKCLDGKQR